MANPEHLQILEQGVEAWNQWRDQHGDIRADLSQATLSRPDLSRADLSGAFLSEANLSDVDLSGATLSEADLSGARLSEANLSGATLSKADLSGAILFMAFLRRATLNEAHLGGAILRRAFLSEADLREAHLGRANLSEAFLSEADLRGADLSEADLRGADLRGANLSQALLYETIFINTNLTAARGLETCRSHGPSTIDHRTLAQSGPLPLVFLRGCGLNDWEIEVTKLYQTGLTPTKVNDIVYRIYDLRADPLIQFYSCFISHASKDYAFAERLYTDLQNKGVRCWFAPEDMKAGDRIRDTIEQQIRLRQKLLIVLSSASIASTWVEDEVEAALDEERNSQERRTVLIPITIDHTVEKTDRTWARKIKRTLHIGDFTAWEDNDAYQQALARLLRDLTAPAAPRLD